MAADHAEIKGRDLYSAVRDAAVVAVEGGLKVEEHCGFVVADLKGLAVCGLVEVDNSRVAVDLVVTRENAHVAVALDKPHLALLEGVSAASDL